MSWYKIKVEDGLTGKWRAMDQEGAIVGPFGIARDMTNGVYRVTHLHSGLKVSQLGASRRSSAIAAAREVYIKAPWWASHKSERISAENGLSVAELKQVVIDAALKCGCEGEKTKD